MACDTTSKTLLYEVMLTIRTVVRQYVTQMVKKIEQLLLCDTADKKGMVIVRYFAADTQFGTYHIL